MSIKTKLSMILSISVLFILLLNITLNYYTTQENLQQDSEAKMVMAATQIAITVEQTAYSSGYVDGVFADMLRVASINAARSLDPDIRNITNEELVDLAAELGVTHISLLVKSGNDIIVAKSSAEEEIGLSTSDWGYWHTAFQELFEHQQVLSVTQGQKGENFWSGPFEFSTSNPEFIDKWGYYYDGKRNYIIDPYIRSSNIKDFVKVTSPDVVVEETIKANPRILEVTGINPDTFGNPSMREDGSDETHRKLKNRPIMFGTYQYGSLDQDVEAVNRAVATGENVVFVQTIQDKKVLKSFIPISSDNRPTSVISVVMDYEAISSVMREQMISLVAISLVLLEIVIFGSYIVAGYFTRPIQAILGTVNDVADGHFDRRLEVTSRDELGQLAGRINAMTRNLGHYTSQLKQMVDENLSVKEYLESVINQTADAIHTTDTDGRIISVNKAFEQMYGWKADEVIGMKPDLVPPEMEQEEAERMQRLRGGERLPLIETVRMRKDGSQIEVSISTSVVRDEHGDITSIISVSRDVTERNRMEELLRRSEKLTTVGQLAAGVAHEIRNPLTTLRGFLQLQQETKKANPDHIDLMLSELDRINLIVSEFLILAKPQAVHFQQKDVRGIMREVLSFLDTQAHLHGVQFRLDFAEEPALVHCEENQLKQVFINLLKNAIEAMPKGGVVRIEMRPEPNEQVKITIEDEGEGIPPELMPHLGEPFITNKETGTGLGLMVSQRIIQGHQGTLEVESEVGQGTKVVIVLPAAGIVAEEEEQKES
ncbi:ATP-binding protein [Paenibacillus sp. 7541]|uniref:ATP-binding protein n=1 Tax=Paenibacillus sp. 7541 TaxID=2026236 RepID=UPI000BA6CDFB|nr:ATP-binding protein [Paenibacillus sp. 7541]PAK47785.1 PAS domain-containing sensor histidine kinase [Paenibacillus sp. 7541]